MIADTKRTKVIEKIKALLGRTVENGCTEAEAVEAARKIGQIMTEHNLSMSEVDVRAEAKDCETGYYDTGKSRSNPGMAMLHGIDRFFGVKSWISQGTTVSYVFFGTPADVAGAKYLSSVLFATMEREATMFLKKHGGGKSAGVTFRRAFSERIASRLIQMTQEREAAFRQNATGTALVALKDQLVEQKYRSLGLNFAKGYRPKASHDPVAAMAGWAAGDRTSLTQAIDTNNAAHSLALSA